MQACDLVEPTGRAICLYYELSECGSASQIITCARCQLATDTESSEHPQVTETPKGKEGSWSGFDARCTRMY
ncbi:hypothetical protein HNY73_012929 [Argiope bruennichi]|uniref:Uncharacterized protein n=1 Tax=Argiope bruennichi TaxID=94029 RepID=A0A8T0EX44_ARGBR|nr:hypothetical protein HNY73_012929 [Argiope bruennichi]